MSLSPDHRRYLLRLAREAVTRAVRGQELRVDNQDEVPQALRGDGASFVTLTKGGALRGCIGSLESRRPLVEDVQENAAAAALRDPRFPPVSADELDDLRIEVSVLSVPEPLSYEGADDLVAKLRPGVDGVIIERGWNRATFLPQVWEKIPDAHQFLQHLCRKAYLPHDSYERPGLHVSTYQVEKFGEE